MDVVKEYKDTIIGRIPKDWEVYKFGNVFDQFMSCIQKFSFTGNDYIGECPPDQNIPMNGSYLVPFATRFLVSFATRF